MTLTNIINNNVDLSKSNAFHCFQKITVVTNVMT